MPNTIMIGVFLTFLAPIVLVLGMAYPKVHNHYVHPLGKLARQVKTGQSCDALANRFTAYTKASGASPEAKTSEHVLKYDLEFNGEIEPSRGISLNDESLFADLELRVRCDSSNQVAEVLYVFE